MDLENYFEELVSITNTAENYVQSIRETIKKKSARVADDPALAMPMIDRKFRTREVSQMLGVSESGLYKAEKEERIPAAHYGINAAGRRVREGWTLEQLLEIRSVFGKLPHVSDDNAAMVLSFPNLKGGCWKTTLSLLASQYYAIAGYRVLLVDTDPQGTLSFFYGYQPDIDTGYKDTIAPFLLFDSLDESEEPVESLHYAIKPTRWPNIDIIPANLDLSMIDTSLPIAIADAEDQDEKREIIERLKEGVRTVENDYDLIIIDGTPSLNLLTISTLIACDHVIVPCPSQMADFASTIQFFNNLKNSVTLFHKGEIDVTFPNYHVLVTKYANAKYSNWMTTIIRKTFGIRTLENVVKKSDEIGKAGTQIQTIYEKQPSKMKNRKSFDNAVDMYKVVFEEIEKKIIEPYFNNDTMLLNENELFETKDGVAEL